MAIVQLTEFGQCACGGMIGTRSVEITLTPDVGVPVVLDDVTQGACPLCGSRYYKAETLKVIEDEFRRIRRASQAGEYVEQN